MSAQVKQALTIALGIVVAFVLIGLFFKVIGWLISVLFIVIVIALGYFGGKYVYGRYVDSKRNGTNAL